MTSHLDIRTHLLPGNILLLELSGALDAHTGAALTAALAAAVASTAHRVVVGLNQVTFIASAGIGAIISANRQLVERGRSLHLAAPSQSVSEVFAILGLASAVPIHAHVIDAFAA